MTNKKTNAAFAAMDEQLRQAKRENEDWFFDYDDSNLAFPGSADMAVAERLVATAPTPFLAGLVVGQLIRNIEFRRRR